MQIPNMLTNLRLLMVPFLGYLLYVGRFSDALILFLIIGLTDILDGYLARKYHLVTKFGKFADPLADKLVQATAIAVLTLNRVIPVMVIVVVVLKEVLLGLGALFLYRKNKVVIAASWYGKLATVFFYIAIVMTILMSMLEVTWGFADYFISVSFGIAIFATLYALYMYAKNFFDMQKSEEHKTAGAFLKAKDERK